MIDKLPEAFRDSISQLLGETSQDFFDVINGQPRSGIRLNPQKTTPEILVDPLVLAAAPLAWEKNGSIIEPSSSLGKHPFHAAGLYYLQEPSAMVPVSVLDPQPGERILDLCAAPGGKTTQIHDRMNGQGILIANDPNPRRVQALARNVERWGGRNIPILSETPARLAAHFGASFDRVLVDAPCSGEGTFRSHPGEIKKWSPGLVKRSAAIQDEILWFASKMVRPGGVLVYSTCTFNQEENEGTITRFLAKAPPFSLEIIDPRTGFSSGIPLPEDQKRELGKTIRIWPHLAPGEGHFIARLRKHPDSDRGHSPPLHNKAEPDPDMIRAYQDFFTNTLLLNENTFDISPDSVGFQTFGSQYYYLPPETISLTGLNVLHWGFWLGSFRGGVFVPSPALAVSVKPEDCQKVIEFSLDDPQLASYMRGSPITVPQAQKPLDGWILISAAGHSLGWGKAQQKRIKSHFPSWLRLS